MFFCDPLRPYVTRMKRMFFSCLIDLNWRPWHFRILDQSNTTYTNTVVTNELFLSKYISFKCYKKKVTFTHEPVKKGRLHSNVFGVLQSPRKNRRTKTIREITFKAAASHFSTNSEFILLLLLTEEPGSDSFRSHRSRAFRYCLCLSNLLRTSRVAMFCT